MSDFYIKQGDTLPEILLTLKDGAAVAIDVSTADSIKFRMRKLNASDAAGIFKVNAEMDLNTDGVDGKVKLTLTSDQTDTAGTFLADVLIDWGGGITQTIPNDSYITVHITGPVSGV